MTRPVLRRSAYGLVIDTNRELPGTRACSAEAADVTIDFRADLPPEVDAAAARTTGERGWMSMGRGAGGSHIHRCASDGGARAWSMEVAPGGGRLEVRWTAGTELGDVIAFVLTRGLAASLAARGVALLHACVLAPAGRAVLVLGSSGAGKSTVAGAALARGWPVLADDIAALTGDGGRIGVHPGVAALRLDERTAQALGWDPPELPRVFTDPRMPGKRLIRWDDDPGDAPRPVEALVVLGHRRAGGPQIARLPATETLPILLGNLYGADLAERDPRADLLPFWARLATEVPALRVHPADDVAALPALLELLERELR